MRDMAIQGLKLALFGLAGLTVIYIATWAIVLAVYLAAFVFAGWVLVRLIERFKSDLTKPVKRAKVRRK